MGGWMVQAIRDGIWTILVVAGPIVTLASVIGLSIGIVQTVTNIQDQTTPTAFKIVGLSTLFIVAGVWMFNYLGDFTKKTFGRAFFFASETRTPVDIEGIERPDRTKEGSMPLPTRDGKKPTQTFTMPFKLETPSIGTAKATMQTPTKTFSQGIELPPLPKVPTVKRPKLIAPAMPVDTDLSLGNRVILEPLDEIASVPAPSEIIKVKPVLPDSYTDDIDTESVGDSLSAPNNGWF